MSAAYRAQIEAVLPDAEECLANQKAFPLPPRPPNQPDSQFYAAIRASLMELTLEEQNVNEFSTDLGEAHKGWMAVRTNMTGPERVADNAIFDTFNDAHPYIQTQNKLKQYARSLRRSRNLLEANLPSASSQSTSSVHIPRMSLPTFTGKCIEFSSFWNQFRAAIGDSPSLTDPIKLSYLKSCLSGPPLSLIEALPLTPDAYGQAIGLLNARYNNSDEIIRSLHQTLKAIPPIRKGESLCSDLAKFIDSLEAIFIQFTQQGADPNAHSLQIEIESKLPPFLLEEVYRAKEHSAQWTVEELKKT